MDTYQSVSEYYGKVLAKTKDLKTNACTVSSSPPQYIAEVLSLIHEDIQSKYYGCGLVIPAVLEGMRILDLGSGAGRDCFILSKLVGESGYVVGVDMTKELLETARKYIDYHTKQFGFSKANIEFREGYIEHLQELGLTDNSFDIIISNCVINLSPDKEAVLQQAYRVLKAGGEMYFSDMYANRRVPRNLREDAVLFGEGLSGALYLNDFRNLAKSVGFKDVRLVEASPITIGNKNIEDLLNNIKFYSATYRLFKIPELEHGCEDYGQAVIYRGGIATSPAVFVLDVQHTFPCGKVVPVCGNTDLVLRNSRFAPFFDFLGDKSIHFGIFDSCGIVSPFFSASTLTEAQTKPSCCS